MMQQVQDNRIYFCKNPIHSLCLLIEKFYKIHVINIFGLDLQAVDNALWTFKSELFIPHTLYENYISVEYIMNIENVICMQLSVYRIMLDANASFMYLHDFDKSIKEQYKECKIYYQKGAKYEAL